MWKLEGIFKEWILSVINVFVKRSHSFLFGFIGVHQILGDEIYIELIRYIDVCYARVKSRISRIPHYSGICYLYRIIKWNQSRIPFVHPLASCQDWFHFKKYIWKAVSHIYYPTISWIEEFICVATHGLIYFTHLRCHVVLWMILTRKIRVFCRNC